jgi:hypothetical protein
LDRQAKKLDCIAQARQQHPNANRQEIFQAARPCLEQAGVPAKRLDRQAKRLECANKVRAEHPGVSRDELRRLVRDCVKS